MSGPEQVLFLVVVPAAIVAVIWALASIGGPQATKRYRPGRPYEFVPVWYLANHEHPASSAVRRPELTAGSPEPDRPGQLQGSTGGASDRW